MAVLVEDPLDPLPVVLEPVPLAEPVAAVLLLPPAGFALLLVPAAEELFDFDDEDELPVELVGDALLLVLFKVNFKPS